METKAIKIISIEQRKTKTGKIFWNVETSEGKMSVWDTELAKDITIKCIGKIVEAEIETNGNFKNLMLINGILPDGSALPEIKTAGEVIGESAKQKRKAEMMTCAKDIVLSAYKDEKVTVMPEVQAAELANKIKIVWKDLMKTIGEQVDSEVQSA